MSKKKLNNKNSNVTKDAKVYRSRLIGELLSPSGSTAVTYKFDTDNNNIRFIKSFPVDKIVNSTNGQLFYFENTINPEIFYDRMDMYGNGSNKKYYCPSYIQYIKDKDIIYNYIKDDNTSKVSIPVNSLVIFIKESDQPCNQNNDNIYQMSSKMLTIPRDLCKITICQEIKTIRVFEYSLVQSVKNDDLFYEYYSNIKNVVFISDGKIDPVYAPDNF